MKIGPHNTKPPVPVHSERKTGTTPVKAAPVPSTEVALSPAATGQTHHPADPSFDTAKVERIAGAIRDGKFSVNAGAIADKLIHNAEELLGRKLT